MKNLQISLRLKEIAGYISKGSFFADIGSDHAYLPSYLCLNDATANAIAGEVNEGPYNKAKEVVQTYNLESRIDVRLGDGLAVLKDDIPDTLVIAGMGGKLIESILTNDLNKTTKINKLILQPNLDAQRLREWFLKYNYNLIQEKIIEENNHFYEVLVAVQSIDKDVYDETINLNKQTYFGPILINEHSYEFQKKWIEEKENIIRIIKDMKRAKEINQLKLTEFENKLIWIEEVLNNE